MKNKRHYFARKLLFLLTSMVICFFVFFQAGVSFRFFNTFWGRSVTFWPFITYPMFNRAHFEGDIIKRYFVVGTLEDSTEVYLLPEAPCLSDILWRKSLLVPMFYDNKKRIGNFIKTYQKTQKKKLIKLRLENRPLSISKKGLTYHSTRVLKDIKIDSLLN